VRLAHNAQNKILSNLKNIAALSVSGRTANSTMLAKAGLHLQALQLFFVVASTCYVFRPVDSLSLKGVERPTTKTVVHAVKSFNNEITSNKANNVPLGRRSLIVTGPCAAVVSIAGAVGISPNSAVYAVQATTTNTTVSPPSLTQSYELGRDGTAEIVWDVKSTGSFPIATLSAATATTRKSSANTIQTNVPKGSQVKISFQSPPPTFFNKLTVYQKTGTATIKTLQLAANGRSPIGRALDIGNRIGEDLKENLQQSVMESTSIRSIPLEKNNANVKTLRNDSNEQILSQDYYEYSMVMPSTGYRYLVAATILDERLYVLLLECNQRRWNQVGKKKKKKNADTLQQARSSFRVESLVL